MILYNANEFNVGRYKPSLTKSLNWEEILSTKRFINH